MFKLLVQNLFGTGTPSEHPIKCEIDRISGEKICHTELSKGFFMGNNSPKNLVSMSINFYCKGRGNSSHYNTSITDTGITILILSKGEINLTKNAKQLHNEDAGLFRFFNFGSRFDNGEPTEIMAYHRTITDRVVEGSDVKMTQLFVINKHEITQKIRAHNKLLLEIHTDTHLDSVTAEFDLRGAAEKIDAATAQCLQK